MAKSSKKASGLKAPAGACDTHMHFYDARFPTADTATFTAPDASVEDYRLVQQALGLERVVVVQPTTYGLDNTCQLEAMAAIGDGARGVMVVDDATSEEELEHLTGLGARGARFHMLPGGAVGWDIIETVAAKVASFGWHIQLQMNGREFVERIAVLRNLPTPLVVDHVGRFTPPVPADDASFRILLGLLEAGNCWCKLSAPYESSSDGPPDFPDVAAEAQVLAQTAPERMLWATNWPHPNQKKPLSPEATLKLLHDWVESEAVRAKILVDNPAELYGF